MFMILGLIDQNKTEFKGLPQNGKLMYFVAYDYCNKNMYHVAYINYLKFPMFSCKAVTHDAIEIPVPVVKKAIEKYNKIMPSWITLILSLKHLFDEEIYDILRHLAKYYIVIMK